MPENFWLLFAANFPFLIGLFVALQKRLIVMGVTHKQIVEDKDKEIAFREQLRQEALADKVALQKSNAETTKSMNELAQLIKQTLELNERLLNENLSQRWDQYDRGSPKASTRA